MSNIRNTTDDMRDPAEQMALLADALATGNASRYIKGQERDGQRQLLVSDRLPTRLNGGSQAEFEALGFTFGDPDPADPMFRPATLPEGWKRKGSGHAMWSYITDQHGRERVSIFYKAAFYDRDAFMGLCTVSDYASNHVEYDGPLVITDEWATKDAVLAAMAELLQRRLDEAADFRGYAADTQRRDEKNRARCAELAGEKEAAAAEYDAAIAALAADGDGTPEEQNQ